MKMPLHKTINLMTDLNPLVSIIIPTYNRASLITETIQSVINQTYQNWECIVVDDGSADDTMTVINEISQKDARFKTAINQRKKGAQGARNTGVNLAKGEYFIFLDSDDLLGENCLTNRVSKFQEYPENDLLVFSSLIFKKKLDDTGILVNVPTTEDILCRFFNLDIPWLSTGPIWKKKSFLKLGYWNEDIPSWHDWELHTRALLKGYQFIHFTTVDNYWRRDYELTTIGKESTSSGHLESHLRLTAALKPHVVSNSGQLAKLNGLIAWIGERALEQGLTNLAVEALNSSHHNLNPIKKGLNYTGIKLFKKEWIKHPGLPDFGTLHKILYKPC